MKVVEFYTLWLAALESGEYPQDQHRLKTKTGFCCLGVAADLLIKHSLIKASWQTSKLRSHETLVYKGRLSFFLPDSLNEVLQLKRVNWAGYTYVNVLQILNDQEGKTFSEIAAYIRQEILPKIDPDLKLKLS